MYKKTDKLTNIVFLDTDKNYNGITPKMNTIQQQQQKIIMEIRATVQKICIYILKNIHT